jgi:2-polyprenyl-3-methyl-5-hydroxy-6-metoxy-1,4-benzoquinol methylase
MDGRWHGGGLGSWRDRPGFLAFRQRTGVDLGAGFGMHSIPLARAGYQVIALDFSAALLQTLREHDNGLPIQTVQGDLRQFRGPQ